MREFFQRNYTGSWSAQIERDMLYITTPQYGLGNNRVEQITFSIPLHRVIGLAVREEIEIPDERLEILE